MIHSIAIIPVFLDNQPSNHQPHSEQTFFLKNKVSLKLFLKVICNISWVTDLKYLFSHNSLMRYQITRYHHCSES